MIEDRRTSLSFGVLGVGDRVSNDMLEDWDQHPGLGMSHQNNKSGPTALQCTPALFVNQPTDSLDSSSTGDSSNGGFGDPSGCVRGHKGTRSWVIAQRWS
jgi:hypothetical protein